MSRTHRERKEQYTKELELEVLRLKELFVTASRERDGASSARDELLSERDRLLADNQKLLEANQRMREIIQSSSSSTDSGYEGTSVSCDVTRNNSLSVADGYPGMVVDPSGPIQEYGTQEPLTTHWQQSAWELCESRGFASDGALQETSPPIKAESTELDVRRFSSAQLVAELPLIQMDYDDLALDFVLSYVVVKGVREASAILTVCPDWKDHAWVTSSTCTYEPTTTRPPSKAR